MQVYGTQVRAEPGTRHLRTLNPKVTFRWSCPTPTPPRRDAVGPIAKGFMEAFCFWAELTHHFPQISLLSGRFPGPHPSSWPFLQTRWLMLDLNFATCYPSRAHVLDSSQTEQLIHWDVLGSPRHLIPTQHISIEPASRISSFCGEPIDSKPRPRSAVLGD